MAHHASALTTKLRLNILTDSHASVRSKARLGDSQWLHFRWLATRPNKTCTTKWSRYSFASSNFRYNKNIFFNCLLHNLFLIFIKLRWITWSILKFQGIQVLRRSHPMNHVLNNSFFLQTFLICFIMYMYS